MLEKYKKLDDGFKKQIHGGAIGVAFWNIGILFSLITSAVSGFIQLIFQMAMASKNDDSSNNETSSKKSFNSNNFGSYNNTYIRLSKYPSDTKMSIGV